MRDIMPRDAFDEQEEIYETVLEDVTSLCEAGWRAPAVVHALIRNAVELVIICADDDQDARKMLANAVRGTLLERSFR